MKGPLSSFRLALWFSSVLSLAVYKAIAVLPVSALGAFGSLCIEAACLALLLSLANLLAQRLPRAEHAATWAFGIAVLLSVTFITSHAFFFASAAERRFSPLEVDLSAVWYFFSNVLPTSGLLGLLATLSTTFGGAFWLARRDLLAAPWVPRVPLGVIALGLLALVALPRIPSPIVDMAYGMTEDLRTPKVRFDAHSKLPGSPLELERLSEPSGPVTPQFSRVLVFVMETMTAEKFENERKALPAESFANAMQANSTSYTRYFPTNQDSRTGMLGMLMSRVIPYEAYTEAGRDHYLYLGKEPSLVDRMRAQGYETAFAVSQNEIELVVGDLAWQHLLSLDEAGLKRAQEASHLCFVPYQFEHSCEDLALLPQVLALIDQHPKLFLYQEFIWGHASEYNEASGKTNTQYYSQYLDAVVRHLRDKGMLDDTLIVLTSDHGFRDTSLQGDPEVVRIPLFMHAPRFEARSDDRLFTHMDFKDLLLHALSPNLPHPEERPFTLVVGPTGSSFLLALTKEHELMWFKTTEQKNLLLRHVQLDAKGQATRELTDEARRAGFLRLFYDYRSHFDAQGRD